jgi:sterol desaturase/sphingolipid hydroxylase (fatty acid hydroxylase superfamily)
MPPFESFARLLVQNFVAQAVGYFAVVGAVYVLVWRWGRERFRDARIPTPARVDSRQIRREIGHTALTLVAGTAVAGMTLALHATGRTRLVAGPSSPAVVGLWFLAGLLFNDGWFYAWHRLLHHPRLFRHVHAIHHRSVDVNPFTSYSFHVVEAALLGAWILPAAILLPIPLGSIAALQIVGLANNVMAHLGYEFLPAWILKIPLLRWTNTATFHSLHHTRSKGNFGLHTRLWDRVFGTEIADYERVFVARGRTPAEAPAPTVRP